MGDKLEALGAVPILFPAIQFVPLPAPELDEALDNLPSFDWLVFTSGNAVRYFWERLVAAELGIAPHYNLRIAAVGSATTQLLAEKGFEIDFFPDEFTGEQLALGLGDLTEKKVLLPRAKIGRPEIVNLLQEQGALVTDIPLYDTITADPDPETLSELEKGIDAVTFTSPSSVRNFMKIVGQFAKLSPITIACIGPSTAAEAEEYGLTVDIVPENYTIDDLITAVAAYFQHQST
jgi:uroporphyrinogen III methyltransferase/synthase